MKNIKTTNFPSNWLWILLLPAWLVFFPRPSFAQDFKMAFSPPLLEVLMKPGTKITQAYWLTNEGQSQSFVPLIIPMQAAGQTGGTKLLINPRDYIDLEKIKHDYPFIDWFSLQNLDIKIGQAFAINQGEKKQLVLKIDIPPQAKLKDYYATFLVFPAQNLINSGETRVSGAIGSQILLSVAEKQAPAEWEIVDFSGPKSCLLSLCLPVADMFDQAKFKLSVKNQSPQLNKATGQIRFYQNRQPVEVQNIRPVNILAGTVRDLQDAGGGSFTFQPPGLAIGKIKAEAEISGPGGDIKSYTFYLLPFKAAAVLILIAVIFFSIKIRLDKSLNPGQK